MITTITSMILFAFIGAASPGPVNIIAASSGATFGFIRTIPFVLGATIAYTIVVFTAGTAFQQLMRYLPSIELYLGYLGAGFLFYMSYKIAFSIPALPSTNTDDNQTSVTHIPGLLQGALCQWLNPKAWLVSLSGVGLFVSSYFYLLIFCLISFFMCFTGVGIWAAVGQLIKHWLTNPRRQMIFNRLMGAMLASSVIMMLLSN